MFAKPSSSIWFLTLLRFAILIGAVEYTSSGIDMVKFRSNQLYTYAFEIVHRIDAAWIEKQDVKEHIIGKMKLSVGSNCLSSLQILNISIKSRTESLGMDKAATMGDDLFKQELSEAIWFCYDNGRIAAFQWRAFDNALGANLKRALLSQLQVSVSSTQLPTYTTEEDILGDCVTEYAPVSTNRSGTMFTKIKYSTGCARRVTLQSILTAVEIQPPSQRSRIPFMDGKVQCELYLASDGIISASHCEEKLVVGTVNSLLDDRPTTVITTVRLRLLQMQASDGVLTTARHFKRLFQKTTNAEALTMEMVLKMKEELLALAFTKEKRDIRSWYLFVQKLRLLDAQALQFLQHVILSTDDLKMRRRFIALLTTAGTANTLNHLIDNAEKLHVRAVDKIKALAAVTTPTFGMLRALRVLISDSLIYTESVYQVTTLIQQLCVDKPECAIQIEVNQVIQAITERIPLKCAYKGDKDLLTLVATLRALGNIGHLLPEESLTLTLEECLKSEKVDNIVKLAAAQTVRRALCPSTIDTKLWDLFSNPAEDPEVRIAIYYSYMRCITSAKLINLTSYFNQEVSQQVGSYVYSHLLNQKDESKPLKNLILQHEREIVSAGKRFNLNPWSYSKYHEWNLPAGQGLLNVQLNVIFGPESFIPRSIGFNVTLNVFEHSINLMELAFRTTSQSQLEALLRQLTRFLFAKSEKVIDANELDEFDEQVSQ